MDVFLFIVGVDDDDDGDDGDNNDKITKTGMMTMLMTNDDHG